MTSQNKKENEYEDIQNLPRHVSKDRPHMSMADRAAQFSPFAALSGYDAAVKETARLTDVRAELDETQITAINERLVTLAERAGEHPEAAITYFVPDGKKAGGRYVTATGGVKKIDGYKKRVIMDDGTGIAMEEIYDIELIQKNADT